VLRFVCCWCFVVAMFHCSVVFRIPNNRYFRVRYQFDWRCVIKYHMWNFDKWRMISECQPCVYTAASGSVSLHDSARYFRESQPSLSFCSLPLSVSTSTRCPFLNPFILCFRLHISKLPKLAYQSENAFAWICYTPSLVSSIIWGAEAQNMNI